MTVFCVPGLEASMGWPLQCSRDGLQPHVRDALAMKLKQTLVARCKVAAMVINSASTTCLYTRIGLPIRMRSKIYFNVTSSSFNPRLQLPSILDSQNHMKRRKESSAQTTFIDPSNGATSELKTEDILSRHCLSQHGLKDNSGRQISFHLTSCLHLQEQLYY